MLNFTYYPNKQVIELTPPDTNIYIWDTNGNYYSTYADLVAAGAKPLGKWNGGAGNFTVYVKLRSVNSGSDGGFFYAWYNIVDTPTDTTMADAVSGSGQQLYQPINLSTLWTSITESGDSVICELDFG